MKQIMFALALGCVGIAHGAPVTFTVDSAQSSLAISSSTTVFGTPLPTKGQGDGSLVTSYSGTLQVDLAPGTIQLLAGSTLVAGISGNWQPGTDYSNYPADVDSPNGYGNTAEPANYGILTDLTALGAVIGKQGWSPSAIRGLEIALVDAAPKPLVGGIFDEAGTATDFTAGTVFYGSGGSPPITNLATTVFPDPTTDALGTGTLAQSGNVLTLTLPVSFSVSYPVSFLAITTSYAGTIVATATIPEPASATLVASGLVSLFFPLRAGLRRSNRS